MSRVALPDRRLEGTVGPFGRKSASKTSSEEGPVKNNRSVRSSLAVVMAFMAGAVAMEGRSNNAAQRQCSLAIVSRAVGERGEVCEKAEVEILAAQGHVYE